MQEIPEELRFALDLVIFYHQSVTKQNPCKIQRRFAKDKI